MANPDIVGGLMAGAVGGAVQKYFADQIAAEQAQPGLEQTRLANEQAVRMNPLIAQMEQEKIAAQPGLRAETAARTELLQRQARTRERITTPAGVMERVPGETEWAPAILQGGMPLGLPMKEAKEGIELKELQQAYAANEEARQALKDYKDKQEAAGQPLDPDVIAGIMISHSMRSGRFEEATRVLPEWMKAKERGVITPFQQAQINDWNERRVNEQARINAIWGKNDPKAKLLDRALVHLEAVHRQAAALAGFMAGMPPTQKQRDAYNKEYNDRAKPIIEMYERQSGLKFPDTLIQPPPDSDSTQSPGFFKRWYDNIVNPEKGMQEGAGAAPVGQAAAPKPVAQSAEADRSKRYALLTELNGGEDPVQTLVNAGVPIDVARQKVEEKLASME